MKTLIKTDYQYFLIILTYLAVWFVAAINYIYNGNLLKAFKSCILAALIMIIFIFLIPIYLERFIGIPYIYDMKFGWIYIYLVSIPASMYFIKDQKRNNLE